MNLPLAKIKPKLVSDQVFEQLRDLIFRGQLKAGAKLLPERELAKAFGVSRPSVKSAINKLVAMGLVEQRQGQGTFVKTHQSRFDQNPLRQVFHGHEINVLELLEVRLGLEVNTAGLAAKRATEEDIEAIANCLQSMINKIDQYVDGTEDDVNFHMTLAYATKNSVLIYLMKNFYDLLFFGIKESRFQLFTKPGNLDKIVKQHQAIFEAIKRREPELARQTMFDHISFVIDFLEGNED